MGLVRKVPALVLACLVGCAVQQSGTPQEKPSAQPSGPVAGLPLAAGSGIRLLVDENSAPSMLDVDTGASTLVSGLPQPDPSSITYATTSSGRHTFVEVGGPGLNQGRVYLLQGTAARKVDRGWFAFPAYDDSGFWITDQPAYGGSCTVRKVTETGKVLVRPRWTYCGALPSTDTPFGLQAMWRDESLLLAHDSLRKVGRYPRIVTSNRQELLVEGKDRKLTLVDPGTGKKRQVDRPSEREAKDGKAGADGRYLAVPFVEGDMDDRLDLWVLDTRTLEWTRLPSMPLPVDVRRWTMRWSQDGRLILAGGFAQTTEEYPTDADFATMIAVWRPGEPSLSLKRLPVHWENHLTIVG
ncbi:hypothetical protein ACIBG8_15640 [Nonomuraea sp. NPDC050556]|uniref:hypothetical protein n=1 Tax=Nonomuraea sp. NPDC050556 TaxID=3364369 RepID=UPI0037A5A751